jgi:hypothetical protein
LANDPNIHPEMLELDLAELELEGISLEGLGKRGFGVDSAGSQLIGSLVSPRQSSGSQSLLGGFSPQLAVSSTGGDLHIPLRDIQSDNLGLEEYPLFEFDEDGEMRDITPELPPPLPAQAETPLASGPRVRGSHAGTQLNSEDIEAQVREEHGERPGGMEVTRITALICLAVS